MFFFHLRCERQKISVKSICKVTWILMVYLTAESASASQRFKEIFLNSRYDIVFRKWYVPWEKTCNFKGKNRFKRATQHIINIFTHSTWYQEIRKYISLASWFKVQLQPAFSVPLLFTYLILPTNFSKQWLCHIHLQHL